MRSLACTRYFSTSLPFGSLSCVCFEMEVDAASNSSSALQQFLILSKSSRGLAAVELIKQVLDNPQIHVFGELLGQPNIKELSQNPEFKQYYDLLELFAYGTYKDYDTARFPELTPQMRKKLRYLTVVSLANHSKIISYQQLSKELDISNLRELENLIIDLIYSNIIKGKMDQQNNWLEISSTVSRDIRPQQLSTITNVLTDWCSNCENVIVDIESQINKANSAKVDYARKKKELEQQISQIEQTIKNSNQKVDFSGDNSDVNIVLSQKDSSPMLKHVKRNTKKPGRFANLSKSDM